MMELPPIIQGGMGFAVSGWQLASAVSRQGQFGVVSGTGLAISFACRLQKGDPEDVLREAIAAFPSRAIADRVLRRWYAKSAPSPAQLSAPVPMPTWPMDPALIELTVLANFVEIHIAKARGGSGPIGLNLLTKIEIMTLPSLYGAMLAGVDAIFMGAGIPRLIPGVLDALARGQVATLPLTVEGSAPEMMHLDPAELFGGTAPTLDRPAFFPIVSSDTLANILIRKSNGPIDGFVVEDHTAGGHNAPPRRGQGLNERGEPIWGELDRPSLGAFRKLGLPFYIAGGQADSIALRAVRALGATGIQIGTPFAFCDESGILPELKTAVIRAAMRGDMDVFTDSNASPTGFPFKVVQLAGTLSDPEVYAARSRTCEFGYLRTAYRRQDGTLGWRCPAERENAYFTKGGKAEDTAGRKCVCAGLGAVVGMASPGEPPIITSGLSIRQLSRYVRAGQDSYSAEDVIRGILTHTQASSDVTQALLSRV